MGSNAMLDIENHDEIGVQMQMQIPDTDINNNNCRQAIKTVC